MEAPIVTTKCEELEGEFSLCESIKKDLKESKVRGQCGLTEEFELKKVGG